MSTSPQSTTKKCHFCAEEVQAEAIKCKHCGESLTKGVEHGTRATKGNKEPCPKCGSYKTIKVKNLTFGVGFAFVGVGGLLFFLVIPIFFIPVGFVLMVVAPFISGKKWMCLACKYKFEIVPKEKKSNVKKSVHISTGKSVLIILIVFFVVIPSCVGLLMRGGDSTSPQSMPVTEQPTPSNTSPAYRLAALQVSSVPNESLVEQFALHLKSLAAKCPEETEERLSDYIYVGWKSIREKGKSTSLLEVAKGIDESLPQEAKGIVKCVEVAAAFTTLVGGK